DARLSEPDRDIPAIESGARAACSLSPFDYRHRLLLATVEEASGDRQAAESTLERARALAPNNAEVIWRQANLLVREGKGAESQEVLRSACASDPALVPIAVDLLWRASNENAAAVESVVPSDPQSRLNLAGFLAANSRGPDAARVLTGIPRTALLNLPDTWAVIAALIKTGNSNLARIAWAELVGANSDALPLIWNGSFEDAPHKNLTQFDWQFTNSQYASVRIDSSVAHSGSKSLKIEFLGRDTTKMDREITQQVVLKSGSRYKLD